MSKHMMSAERRVRVRVGLRASPLKKLATNQTGIDVLRRQRLRADLRGASRSQLGPNDLKIGKETTHDLARWTRVASMA